jgi:1,4-alpha-glucan branching enzyme
MMFLGQNPVTSKIWSVKENKYNMLMSDELKFFTYFMEELNILYEEEPALYQKDYELSGFQWVNAISPDECVYTFIRNGKKAEDTLFIICNFANKLLEKKEVGVPFYGKYKEIFNTSMKKYGGNTDKIARKKTAVAKEINGMGFSIKVNLEPLCVSIFKCEKEVYKINKKSKLIKKVSK